ncbi:hypothetical protein [Agrococcus sp. Marseille-P2731]|uniref:hypothetical protein n=1 Tax=Agrococcus sp. Marseille-P2731 TaxID=1841862 RepID=UPI00135648E7|nr:hypothetical protein [Agrococcus sp. Marseille-P2731]
MIAGPASNAPLRPGERVELTIENLAPFCADTPRMTDNANDEPVDAFDVVWVQGDRRTVIDVVQPTDGSPFTVDITVPADAAAGAASILIGTAALPVEVAAAR